MSEVVGRLAQRRANADNGQPGTPVEGGDVADARWWLHAIANELEQEGTPRHEAESHYLVTHRRSLRWAADWLIKQASEDG